MMITQEAVDWFKTQFTRLKESVMGTSNSAVLEPEVIEESTQDPEEEVNIVEAMLAEVPQLSAESKDRIREQFPDGKVCCPIKVARAIQLELANEHPKGKIKFTAGSSDTFEE